MPFSVHKKTFSQRRRFLGRSVVFLFEGGTDGICTGSCIAGTDVDLFCCTSAGTVMIDAVGYVTGNTAVLMAGLTGFFGRIVVHG